MPRELASSGKKAVFQSLTLPTPKEAKVTYMLLSTGKRTISSR
jgi:hypothetical protein